MVSWWLLTIVVCGIVGGREFVDDLHDESEDSLGREDGWVDRWMCWEQHAELTDILHTVNTR